MESLSFISAAAVAAAGNSAPSPAVKDAWSAVREYFYMKSPRLTKIVMDLESGEASDIRKMVLCEELEKFRVFQDAHFLALATKLEAAVKAAPAPKPAPVAAAAPVAAPEVKPAAEAEPAPAPAPTPVVEPQPELSFAEEPAPVASSEGGQGEGAGEPAAA